MKTKRMKKLLMAEGLSRNQVNRMVREQRLEGSPKVSNRIYYHLLKRDLPWFRDSFDGKLLPQLSSFVVGTKEQKNGQEELGKSGGEIPEES